MKIETLPLSAVVTDPANVRLHDQRNLDTIRGSLARFGQQKPIVVDSAGVIRAGNGTYLAAKALGWETIDVVRTSLAGLDAAAFAIADNRTSDLSTFDDASLAKLLQELGAAEALDGVGFDEAEIQQLLADLERDLDGGTVEDPGPEEPPERPVSRLGDLWIHTVKNRRGSCQEPRNEPHQRVSPLRQPPAPSSSRRGREMAPRAGRVCELAERDMGPDGPAALRRDQEPERLGQQGSGRRGRISGPALEVDRVACAKRRIAA